MSSTKLTLREYIEQTTKNVDQDRSIASMLLLDLVDHMNKHKEDKYTHKNFGEIASRYLETLQRSNEQLVKIAAILQRQEGSKDEMSKQEKDELFDLIKKDL
jgi:uncharacterized protein with von Willebrand factor type A (vWA) domain